MHVRYFFGRDRDGEKDGDGTMKIEGDGTWREEETEIAECTVDRDTVEWKAKLKIQ